ncbi:uncharacterized protein LOC111325290 isoform X3 [Stylophora pistillata]|uniref:uncharacterized protein LOC111325290 isoform X3 n=1 Tax=Stylophora pistillata TaxID=50429 RepID=UPI000C03DD4E|nr:uncharacterized protein LOC111325290 isoform X3 [Stylophora pistillata]
MIWETKTSAITLVILVLKLTMSVTNGEVRVIEVGRVNTQVVCQGTELKFKCQNTSLAMVIYSASYGREEEGRITCPFGKAPVDDSVIQANETDDQTLCDVVDVTPQIMKLCDKKRRCIIDVNNATYYGNPCKKIYKYVKIIYGCEEKWKTRTYPPYTTPPSYGTDSTSLTVTNKKPKTPKLTPTRKRVTTLTTLRKKITNITVRRSRARTPKPPHSTKRTTTPKTPLKTTSKLSTLSSTEMPTKRPITSAKMTKTVTPTTVKDTTTKPLTVSKGVETVKPSTTVPKSDASVSVTNPLASTNPPNERDKQSPTTSTGTLITIPVNDTNYTLPNKTLNTLSNTARPSKLTITPTGRSSDGKTQQSPSPETAFSSAPVVMGQASPEVVMGVAGSLYLWFLHMKENQATYTTVFILSALGAAIIMVAAVACFLTLHKKKEFIKLDVMHKPKRFIGVPKESGTKNQNGHVPEKVDKPTDAEEAPDGIMVQKGPEVVFTAHDVNNHVPKEFNIDRYPGTENGSVSKENEPGIHVNPMFNNNNYKLFSSVNGTNQTNPLAKETVNSLPSTPSRSRNLSEPRTGPARQGRANSTGNVSRSHERHHSQLMSDYQEERARIPRHLSAGNVSHQHRHMVSEHASHPQSPARTLPRQRPSTGHVLSSHSPVRDPNQWHQATQPTYTSGMSTPGMINSTSQQHSPARSVSGGTLLSQSSTLNSRQQSPGIGQLSPSRNPQHSPLDHSLRDAGPGTLNRDGEPKYQGKSLSIAPGEHQVATHNSSPYQRSNVGLNSPMKVSSSSNAPLGLGSSTESHSPYKAQRNTPTLNRKWSEEKSESDVVPNITTNPNYINTPGDVWLKNNDPNTGQKDATGRGLSTDQSSMQGGILQHRRESAEKSSLQEQFSSQGTMRATSMGELLSPLDALPDTYANSTNLRLSDRHSYSNTRGTSSFHPSSPQPPEPPDSSDDDLYSIVAKGTYTSAVPDPNLRHTTRVTSAGREGKSRSKHVYVVVPSGDGSTAV